MTIMYLRGLRSACDGFRGYGTGKQNIRAGTYLCCVRLSFASSKYEMPGLSYATRRSTSTTTASFMKRVQELWHGLGQEHLTTSRNWNTPLRNPSKQIRLLKLPTMLGQHGRVEVTMRDCDLDKLPTYRAISYTWGPPFRDEDPRLPAWIREQADLEIVCNGQQISVSQSLLEALQHIIPKYPGIFLWVDALCIDQQNEAEKLKQINLMDIIYGEASEVIVWLGPEGSSEELGIGNMTSLARVYNAFTCAERTRSTDTNSNEETWKEFLELPPLELYPCVVETANAFFDIWSRAWWARVWTFQEAVLAKKSVFLCGSLTFDPRRLQQLIEHLALPRMFPPQITEFLLDQMRLNSKLDLSSAWENAFFPSRSENCESETNDDFNVTRHVMSSLKGDHSFAAIVFLLIILTRGRTATDRRDLVLGLMGVAKAVADRLRGHIKTDFDVAHRSTYGFLRETIDYLLLHDPYLEVLRYSHKYLNSKGWNMLPSYSRDFYTTETRPRIRVTDQSACGAWNPADHGMNRKLSSSLALGFPTFLVFGNQAFGLRGIRVGPVHDISQVPGMSDNPFTTFATDDFAPAQWACLRAILDFCRHLPLNYLLDPNSRRGLWRTLILNTCSCDRDTFQIWAASTFYMKFAQSQDEERKMYKEDLRILLRLFGHDETILTELSQCVSDAGNMDELNQELWWRRQESGIFLPMFPYYLFRTGEYGAGSTCMTVEEGDEVWILEGARHPFILRRTWYPKYFRLVGEAYVGGVMQGEVIRDRGPVPEWADLWLV